MGSQWFQLAVSASSVLVSELWRVRLLGRLQAERTGQVVQRFRTQKTGLLLAYLAYYHTRPHSREVLIELLWPHADAASGRNSLSIALSSLRHQLEPPEVGPGAVLVADRFQVQFRSAALTTDTAEFDGALRAASAAAETAEQIRLLSRGVELYRGPLLEGHYEEWVLVEQQRLADLFLQAVRELTEKLEKAGDSERAIDYARRAVSIDPLREEAHGDLMRLLAAAGQPAAALRQYRELEALLRQGLGVSPHPATRQLAHEIERSPGPSRPAAALRMPHSPAPGAPLSGTMTLLLVGVSAGPGTGETPEAAPPDGEALRQLARREIRRFGGHEIPAPECLLAAVFPRASHAVASAMAIDRGLPAREERSSPPGGREPEFARPDPGRATPGHESCRVRIALDTAEVELAISESRRAALDRCLRLLAAAHAGQSLCSEATAALLRRDLDPQIRLTELGLFRLLDGGSLERLFQVNHPDAERRDFPPPQALPVHYSNLPIPFTPFFGRERELRQLAALLRPRLFQGGPAGESPRLVTITGPGGTGKTRLALEAARRVVDSYRAAVWFVRLEDLSDSARLAGRIHAALRLLRSPDVEPLGQIVQALGHEPSLLILDNFEHLLGPPAEEADRQVNGERAAERPGAAVHLVDQLLERVPTLTCLITSRQRLDHSLEREFPLRPLATPARPAGGQSGISPLEDLTRNESVQLFVDRAQMVRPDFQVTKANAPAIAELCFRLEGLPLAIELAASRAQLLTPAQMLRQMEQRFQFLISRQRDVSERHRTMRAALEWSYQFLTPELQRFFGQLSVFRGGCTLAAAEAVCTEQASGADRRTAGAASLVPTADALDHLAQLQECSLVLTEEHASQMQFRMLETVREFAAEQLTAEQKAAIQRRHAEYYLALAEESERALTGPDQGECLDRLEAAIDNFRAALAWLVERDPPFGLELAGRLWRFWMTRGYLNEGREWLDRALRCHRGAALPGPDAPGEDGGITRQATLARALFGSAVLAHLQSEDDRALPAALESRRLYETSGDEWNLSALLGYLGDIIDARGDPVEAARVYHEGLVLARKTGNRGAMAYALCGIGRLQTEVDRDFPGAAVRLAESLSLYRSLGDQHHLSMVLWQLGHLAVLHQDYERAFQLFQEDLSLSRGLKDARHIATGLVNLGTVARIQGEVDRAQALFDEALSLYRRLGQKRGEASALIGLGRVAMDRGDCLRAQSLYREGLEILEVLRDQAGTIEALIYAGFAATAAGDGGDARRSLTQAIQSAQSSAYKRFVAWALEGFAVLAMREGSAEASARLFGAAEALRVQLNIPLPAFERRNYEPAMSEGRAVLGEEWYAAVWKKGGDLPPEQAIAAALAPR